MRRVEHLISQVRRQTENVRVGTSDGIDDIEFVQYLNDAQDRLMTAVIKANNRSFTKEATFSPVKGQEAYDLPFDTFTKTSVINLQYSQTGQDRDYGPVHLATFEERDTTDGYPINYILRNGQILINPIPLTSNGLFRLTYNPRLPKLDIRSGQITSFSQGGSNITALTLNNAFTITLTNARFNEIDEITIVDRDGVIKTYDFDIDSVNTSSGVVTITNGSHTLLSGESIANNQYVCLGNYTTTHSRLPDMAERYLVSYCAWKIFKRDSSEDRKDQENEIMMMERDIIEAFALQTGDVDYIPIINDSWWS